MVLSLAIKIKMYFVRRLIRRSVRYARNLGINNNFILVVVEKFSFYYKDEYSNLEEKKDLIELYERGGKNLENFWNMEMKQFEKIC